MQNLTSVCSLTTSALLAITPVTLNRDAVSSFVKIESLLDISTDQPSQTLFLFDIDDTIFDSPQMLGSKAWRKYILEATKQIDPKINWHDIFSHELAEKYPLETVEKITSQCIEDLQRKGYVVCGFTSRERNLWYDMPQNGVDILTMRQLLSVDVDFNTHSLENVYPHLAAHSEYFGGIFFANIEPKGNFLSHLLKDVPHPEKILFIDDKPLQVESVAHALRVLDIDHECYLYSATDKKGEAFYPLIANIQLYYFYLSNGKELLSDTEALKLAKENPQYNAEYYLRATIDFAKKKLRHFEEEKI